MTPPLTDADIARSVTLRPIQEVAAGLGLPDDAVTPYGRYKAKLSLDLLSRPAQSPRAKYVCVTGMSPTPAGEGKTTTVIGLGDALNRRGRRTVITLREPSMGPVFGAKGPATGGGWAQVAPRAEINLHFTGDFYAVERAHNLLAAMVDNHLHFGNEPWLDPRSVVWRRVMDMNDRALRNTLVGLGGRAHGVPRETGFDITAASEVMSVLTLASGMADLRDRLGRMVVGTGTEGVRITASALQAVGAMTALLVDAARPNLVQTLEGSPALVHCGPFANISIGASSVVADRMAAGLAEFVVTESGFGADLGFEKLCNIKSRVSGMTPDCAVLVATVRALKFHSGRYGGVPADQLTRRLSEPNLDALRAGAANLAHHVSIVRRFGVPAVVALNRFASDSEAEVDLALHLARDAGAAEAAAAEHHAKGGAGADALAEAVERASAMPSKFEPLYKLDIPLMEKIQLVATQIYGAEGVAYDQSVSRQLHALERQGFGQLPVCLAKTPQSISHDPRLLGHPAGFVLPITGVRLFAGAGFVTALCGAISLMPGLGRRPAAVDIDVDPTGAIVGF